MAGPADIDAAVSRIASAIGDPARARMLFTLLDGRGRTSTELALVAGLSPSTTSSHLGRLLREGLVRVHVQGRHRYYGLAGAAVAEALEGLSTLAGSSRHAFVPNTPSRLRGARTCYDHIAGTLGVALHDRLVALGWLATDSDGVALSYDLTPRGINGLTALGIGLDAVRGARRRFAYGCLDWSERRLHLGGGLGAALLTILLKRRWVEREQDSRALRVTGVGRRELALRLGVRG